MPNSVGPVALQEILSEFVDELDDHEATELASVDTWVDRIRSHVADRVRAADDQ